MQIQFKLTINFPLLII